MAKTSIVQRELKKLKAVAKGYDKRSAIKEERRIAMANHDHDAVREAQDKLDKLPRNTSASRLRRRCQITGRSRGVYKKFGLSRIKIRELANQGLIPGVRKSSW